MSDRPAMQPPRRALTRPVTTLGALVAGLVCLSIAAGNANAAQLHLAGSWVGTVNGGRALVAVVVKKAQAGGRHSVLAYVCNIPALTSNNGSGGSNKIAEWFKGRTGSDHFSLTSKTGYRLDVTVGRKQTTGTLTSPGTPGTSRSFAAIRAKGVAGLYRAKTTLNDKAYLAGLIVVDHKSIRGAGSVTLNSTLLAGVSWTLGSGQAFANFGTVTLTAVPTAPIGPLPVPVVHFSPPMQDPFSFDATHIASASSQVTVTSRSSPALSKLARLATTRTVTPKVVVNFGTTYTYTFFNVTVLSVRLHTDGSFDAVFAYKGLEFHSG